MSKHTIGIPPKLEFRLSAPCDLGGNVRSFWVLDFHNLTIFSKEVEEKVLLLCGHSVGL